MKTIEYDGLIFVRDDKTGYYLNAKTHKRLHRYVWEKHNGEIPKGYEIHHMDKNKANNNISNLQMLSQSEHMKLHGSLQTDEEKQRKRDNLTHNVRPKASMWHGSEKGIEWHKKHYEEMKNRLHERKEFKCKQCGKSFISIRSGFCCNACKSAYRRKMGYDNIIRECAYCGKPFETNKYTTIKYCSRTCTMKDRYRKLKNIS